MTFDRIARTASRRISVSWRDSAISVIAAAIAWTLSIRLLGHGQPIFAPISAIICLAPGLPSHGRQAIGLMLGVTAGIAVSEASLLLHWSGFSAGDWILVRTGVATFVAMMIAAAFAEAPVVPIQAGVSSVLVSVLGPQTAGFSRFEDVLIGVAVGLSFSQIILTPNPLRKVDAAASALFARLAAAFRLLASAVQGTDNNSSEAAVRKLLDAHQSLIDLDAGIESARHASRWSLRGRLAAGAVNEAAEHYDRTATRLFASSLLLVEAVAEATRDGAGEPPPQLAAALASLAVRAEAMARGDYHSSEGVEPPAAPAPSADWSYALVHVRTVGGDLRRLEQLGEQCLRPKGRPGEAARPIPGRATT